MASHINQPLHPSPSPLQYAEEREPTRQSSDSLYSAEPNDVVVDYGHDRTDTPAPAAVSYPPVPPPPWGANRLPQPRGQQARGYDFAQYRLPVQDNAFAPMTPQRSTSQVARSRSDASSRLSPEVIRERDELPLVQRDRAYVQGVQEAVKKARKTTNRVGRFLGLATGFSAAGIATVSTVAALTHAAPLALFATVHFAVPLAAGITVLGLLAAFAVRSLGRRKAQKNQAIDNGANNMLQIATQLNADSQRDGGPTALKSLVVQEALHAHRDVTSVGRDFRKSLRDGIAGLFWPVTVAFGVLNDTRRKL